MAQLVTTAVIRASDQLTGPLTAMASKVKSTNASIRQSAISMGTAATGAFAAASTLGLQQLLATTKESAQLTWDAQAALMGTAMQDEKLGTMEAQLEDARKKAEALRQESMRLSKVYGIMPELFQKSGAEAAKMGLDYEKSKAMMKATGLIHMSDREADAGVMTKALGTYGIIYGAEKDAEAYAKQVERRAAQLALAGNLTRTSASKIEEGMRNLMGIHGAFGGKFEDAVAMVAMGAQSGMFEKEAGTAIKSLSARFLNMPQSGRAALAAAKIDMSKFQDFGNIDPTRATNQLIGLFPQQLQKGARGKLFKFLETARNSGQTKDPLFVNEVIKFLEQQGLKYAGQDDRNYAARKVGAILHGSGGKFDPIGLLDEINRAIKDGRAGPDIWAAIGEPKRLHQNAAFTKGVDELKALRDLLLNDPEKYFRMIEKGFGPSDIGKISRMEAAFRRFQLSLVHTEAIQNAVGLLGDLGEKLASLPPAAQNALGVGAVFAAIAAPVGIAARAIGGMTLAMWGLATASTAAGGRMLMAFGSAAMAPFVAAAASMRQVAWLSAGTLGTLAAAGSRTALLLGGATLGVVGLAAALGVLALTEVDWNKFFSADKTDRTKNAMESMKKSASGLADDIGRMTDRIKEFAGIKVEPKDSDGWFSKQFRADIENLDRIMNWLRGNGAKTSAELEEAERNGEPTRFKSRTWGDEVEKDHRERGFDPGTGMPLAGDIAQQIKDGIIGAPLKVENLTEDGIASKTSNPIVGVLNSILGAIQALKVIGGNNGSATAPTPSTTNGANYGKK